MPGRPKAVLALDLGSTTFRAALFAADGTRVATAALPSQLAPPDGGRAEHDPEAWWRALRELVGRLLGDGASREVQVSGLAVSAFTRTQVFLGEDGTPVRPAITWRDGRAGAEAAHLAAAIEAEGLGEALGTNPPSAFHPLARMLWVQAHEPARLARTRWVTLPQGLPELPLDGCRGRRPAAGGLLLDPRTLELPRGVFTRLGLDPALIRRCPGPRPRSAPSGRPATAARPAGRGAGLHRLARRLVLHARDRRAAEPGPRTSPPAPRTSWASSTPGGSPQPG
jgi:xylulokinase